MPENESRYPTVSLCKFKGLKCSSLPSTCNQSGWQTLKDLRDEAYQLEDFYENASLSRSYYLNVSGTEKLIN